MDLKRKHDENETCENNATKKLAEIFLGNDPSRITSEVAVNALRAINVIENMSNFMEIDNQVATRKKFKQNVSGNQPIHETWEFDLSLLDPLRTPPLKDNFFDEDVILNIVDIHYETEFPDKAISNITQNGKVPVVKLFCTTEEGCSVLLSVYNFYPYLYFKCDRNYEIEDGNNSTFLYNFKNKLEAFLQRDMENTTKGTHTDYVLSVEYVRGAPFMPYNISEELNHLFVKVTLAEPSLVPKVRKQLSEIGLHITDYGMKCLPSFESNILFILRFMIDKELKPCTWFRIPKGEYKRKGFGARESACKAEIIAGFESLHNLGHEGKYMKLPKIKTLSFDIECAGRPGIFPEPEKDPVIQIGIYVSVLGEEKPLGSVGLTLNTCKDIDQSIVLRFKYESSMLMAFAQIIREIDPDIITGYNIANFDIPYCVNRAKAIRINEMQFLSRLLYKKIKLKESTFSSNQYGKKETFEITCYGRTIFDLYIYVQKLYKLRSYSLNAVALKFLGEMKEDVAHHQITPLFNGDDIDRRRLLVYCLKDSLLPIRLINYFRAMYSLVQDCRVYGVSFFILINSGMQKKIISMLYRKAKPMKKFINYYAFDETGEDDGYQGATVLEPMSAFYETPIATLDFQSLYPSIQADHNLSHDAHIERKDLPKFLEKHTEKDYELTPEGDAFVKAHIYQGIFVMIVLELLSGRKKAKEDLKDQQKNTQKLKDMGASQKEIQESKGKETVWDIIQLCLKLAANSVYGFSGAVKGHLPCLEVSKGITSWGRVMIDNTKAFVEQYCLENALELGLERAIVVYGDTDSVMINIIAHFLNFFAVFGMCSVWNMKEKIKVAMALGKLLSKVSTEYLRKKYGLTIAFLDFEKIYCPYLLISKKRYAGLFWTNPDKFDKLDAKGIESVRRDNCLLLKTTMETVLKKVLIDIDIKGAINYVKDIISKLLEGKIDISLLVITQELKKEAAQYKNKQTHAEVAEKMKKRDPGSAPKLGDRVQYAMTKSLKNAKKFEKAEDPEYIIDHKIPIDYSWYIKNQFVKPFTRVFSLLMDDPESLFNGEHTKKRIIETSKTSGIGLYTIKTECLGCKKNTGKKDVLLCDDCEPFKENVYAAKLAETNLLEKEYNACWTQCQVCPATGSLIQKVLCTSRDCPNYYKRKKVTNDLKDSQGELNRLTAAMSKLTAQDLDW